MHRYSDYTNNKKNLCREDKSLNGHLTKPKRDVLPAIEIGPNTKPPNTPKRCKTRASHRITRITPQTNLHSVNYYPALPQIQNQNLRESKINENSLPQIQTPSTRKNPLPKLPTNQIQKQKSRGRLSELPVASEPTSVINISDIVGVEITDYCPQSTLSDDTEDEIVIDCSKFQCLPHVKNGAGGVLENRCNLTSIADHQQRNIKDRKSAAQSNINIQMDTTRRLTRRAVKTSNRLSKFLKKSSFTLPDNLAA